MAMRLSQKRSETVTPHSAPNLAYARPFVVQRQSEDREQALPEAGVSLLNNRYQVGATPNYQPGWIARAQVASQPRAVGIQAKLAIGQPNDKYEQEADSVAEQVMSMPDAKPAVQREGMPGEEEELQTKSLGGSIQREAMPEEEEEVQAKSLGGLIQREAMGDEEEEIQAKRSSGGGVEVGGDFESRLGSSKSGGSPLPEDVRSFMEPRFGADFSGVRVHTGSDAVQMNRGVNAQAFAHGSDIYFGAGKAPGKDALTAHELTHVVQQTGEVQRRIDVGRLRNGGNFQIAPIHLQRAPGTAAVTTHPTLEQGAIGGNVKKLQQHLNAQGLEPPLKIDGIFGKKTKAAVVAFQQSHQDDKGNNLPPNGIVDKKTWGAIDREAATPKIEATDEAMGQHVIEGMDANNNNPQESDRGIHYAFNYQRRFPELWKEDYWNGYADPTYFDRIGFMDWTLKPRKSASAAVQSWLRGLTIAECNSAIVAIEIDTLRNSISDAKFDKHFGSTDRVIPKNERLRIKPGTAGTPVGKLMSRTNAVDEKGNTGTEGKRPNLKVGGWYYFYNHPQYLLKHPGGAFQGENAIFMGEEAGQQLWSGMGVAKCTELKMLEEMVEAYNSDRDARDLDVLKGIRQQNKGTLPSKYDSASGEFPERLSGPDEILSAAEYELDGVKRKGGFQYSGKMLDATSVQQLKDE
jgi:hypothetical protein